MLWFGHAGFKVPSKHPRETVKQAVVYMILVFRGELREGDINLGVTDIKEIIEALGMGKNARNHIDEEIKESSIMFWVAIIWLQELR